MFLEALLAILIKEELRVGQAGAQHALIAVLDRLEIFLAAVAHGDEERQELARIILDREIPLMIAHRRDDRLRRELQVLLLEPAAERRRVLDEIEHFFEQIVCNLRTSAVLLGDSLDLCTDHRLAFLRIDDNVLRLAVFLIVVSLCNRKISLGKEAMTARNAP